VAVDARTKRSRARARARARSQPRPSALSIAQSWPAEAWGAIGVCTLFLAITWWWLTKDHTVPLADAGYHLTNVLLIHEELSANNLHAALAQEQAYPPLAYLVGTLGILVGGVGVNPPILAENLVFVPLLALGCYQLGRIAFNPLAGLLAVVFALGSPLIAEQFHVFMIDAPETAMVAVSVWLVIITRGFSRLWMSALAGLVVGLALLTKEPIPFFLAGIVGVTAVRGGWRSWRGLAVFAAVALAIALPWYLYKYTEVHSAGLQTVEPGGASSSLGIAPSRFSPANLEWYFWSILNSQLYAPLLVFAAVGWWWMTVALARRRPISPLSWELVIGTFAAWLILTETYVHDPRYSMPLLVFLAVVGSGWIVRLPRRGRLLATGALGAVAMLNLLTATFGLGSIQIVKVPGITPYGRQSEGLVTLYSNGGFLVAGPHRDGDMLGTFEELKRYGVRAAVALPSETFHSAAFIEGLFPLALIAKIEFGQVASPANLPSDVAVLDYEELKKNKAPPCVKLEEGVGVWIRLGNPYAPGAQDFCPSRKPQFYS
jgi:hypothetical protein